MGKRLHDTVTARDLALMVVSDAKHRAAVAWHARPAVGCPLRLQGSTVASASIQGGTCKISHAPVKTPAQDGGLRYKNKDKKNKDEKNKNEKNKYEKNKGEKNKQGTALLHYTVAPSWRRGAAVRGRARCFGSPTTIAERECKMQTALDTLSRVGRMKVYALENISNFCSALIGIAICALRLDFARSRGSLACGLFDHPSPASLSEIGPNCLLHLSTMSGSGQLSSTLSGSLPPRAAAVPVLERP